MQTPEIVLISIFVIGIVFILYIIFRDPILMFKSCLRALKSDNDWRFKVLFFPIWGPLWLIDRIFKFKIFIKNIEEASRPIDIKFDEYDKYIQIDYNDINLIENLVQSYGKIDDQNIDEQAWDYIVDFEGIHVLIAEQGDNTILKFDKKVKFDSFHYFVTYINNLSPKNRIFHTKAILINPRNYENTYFCFQDIEFQGKLVGKTYSNKKLYINLNSETQDDETIYLNSNISYFRNFNFNKFESEITRLKFQKINL